jgi:Carbohydrate binding module family 56
MGMLILFTFSFLNIIYGWPSGKVYPPEFTYRNGEWYDSYDITRTNYAGSNGFLPNLAYESIPPENERAYDIGKSIKDNYPNRVDRAEEILSFVQRWTDYGYDEENVQVEGEYQPEWAWNADEMAHMFNQNTFAVAIGDCEDMAFLCSTLYLAADFDVSIISPPEHVALMIWLPEYSNANYYWDLNDGRGKGWIWVEATGENNPLGWTPPDYTDGNFEVYSIGGSSLISNVNYSPTDPQAEDDVIVTVSVTTQSSISQAKLRYSVDGGAQQTLSMTRQGSSFKATIPRQADGSTVEFYVSVTDTGGIVSDSSTYSYTVGGGGGLEIPGFPVESIFIGLIIGFIALYSLARKRSATNKPATQVSFANLHLSNTE